jgi:lipopolysaccharide export system permease protein
MLTLAVLNQELLIPRIAHRLTYSKDDPSGQKEIQVRGAYDYNEVHGEGERANRKLRTVRPFRVTIPPSLAGNLIHLQAEQAYYVPTGPRQGYWELTGTHPAELPDVVDPQVLQVVDTGRYRLYTRDLTFDALTRDTNWYVLASTGQLFQELQRPESNRLAPMAVLFHARLTRPLLGLVLVLLGLSVILRDQNRNIFISSGLCLALCGVFFAAIYSCKMLGDNDLVSPVLAAWLPVIAFGPFAVVLFDAVHT